MSNEYPTAIPSVPSRDARALGERAMDGPATTRLARFCADQYFSFDPAEWIAQALLTDRSVIAAAARYLSLTSWYGREDDLARIAATLEAASSGGRADTRTAGYRGLKLAYFAAILRIDIASRRQSMRQKDRPAQAIGG